MARMFDYRPLQENPSEETVRRFRVQAEAAGLKPIVTWGMVAFVAVLMIVPFAVVAVVIWAVSSSHPKYGLYHLIAPLNVITVPVSIVFWGGYGVLCALLLVNLISQAVHRWRWLYQLTTFAEVNDLSYVQEEKGSNLGGEIFSVGSLASRSSMNVFRSKSVPLVEMGNFFYKIPVVRSGKPAQDLVPWGYLAVEVGGYTPRIMLRSTSRASRKRWGSDAYTGSPVVSLGAALDAKYTLYCPQGFEEAALAMFSPSVLARLRALGSHVSADLDGGYLYVYSIRRFNMRGAKKLKPRFDLAQEVGAAVS